MKEIGLKLKEKREENGVTIEEAAADLKMRESQLMSIEAGDKSSFKDIFSLKFFIRDYAKYLGLDGEAILDEFNEYLFEETSKISVEEINQAKKEKEEKEKNMKILSPYTVTSQDRKRFYIIIGIVVFLILLGVIIYFVSSKHISNDFIDSGYIYRNWRVGR